jgi:hypothetical protein
MRYALPLLALLTAASLSNAAATRPFPRVPAPGFAIRTAVAASDGSDIQKRFESWRKDLVFERPTEACVFQGSTPRNPVYCASAELAYGMLIAVYMDNGVNQTQGLFDKFLAAYDKRLDSNGLGGWSWSWKKIDSVTYKDSLLGVYAATDADLDAAMALLLASRQWNDDKYRQRAERLIQAIWKHEVDSTRNLKPGDDWDLAKNPSYLNFPAFHLFAQVDSHRWDTVAANSWTMLQQNVSAANTSVGLPSEWCGPTGTPYTKYGKVATSVYDKEFHSNAMRVPWRLAIEYAWFGDSRVKDINGPIATWAINSSPFKGDVSKISYTYRTDGFGTLNSPYPEYLGGAFGAAGLHDRQFQAWVDSCYKILVGRSTGVGNLDCLNLLHSLLWSGQFENLWQTVPASVEPRQNPPLLATPHGIHVPQAIDPPRIRTANGKAFSATVQRDPVGGWRILLPRTAKGLLLVDWSDANFRHHAAPVLAP